MTPLTTVKTLLVKLRTTIEPFLWEVLNGITETLDEVARVTGIGLNALFFAPLANPPEITSTNNTFWSTTQAFFYRLGNSNPRLAFPAPYCKLTKTTGQAIGGSAEVFVNWDVANQEGTGWNATAPHAIIIKQPGTYRLDAAVRVSGFPYPAFLVLTVYTTTRLSSIVIIPTTNVFSVLTLNGSILLPNLIVGTGVAVTVYVGAATGCTIDAQDSTMGLNYVA